MGNKTVINGNTGYRHNRTRYKPPLRGLYLDARKTAGYVERSNYETPPAEGEVVDNIVFDIPSLSGPDLELVDEGVELDIPRDWGGWQDRDIPGGFTIRDWFGGDPTGDNPKMSLHFVGALPGLANEEQSISFGISPLTDVLNYDWVYRYGKKFARAPGYVAGCAKYRDALGRNWLLVSSFQPGQFSFGTYISRSKFVLYYTPWRYVGDYIEETTSHGWIDDDPIENYKWRKIELERESGVYSRDNIFPSNKELAYWVFNSSGTKLTGVIRTEERTSSGPAFGYLTQVNDVSGAVLECVELEHFDIGIPGRTPRLEATFINETKIPLMYGSIVQDFRSLGTLEEQTAIYNDPLNGNVDQEIITSENWMMDRRSSFRGRFAIAADYVGDKLRIATLEPDTQELCDVEIEAGNLNVFSAETTRDLELTGDITTPTWDDGTGQWVCDTGYTYYPGPGGSQGKCAKVLGRAYDTSYRVGFDSDSSQPVGSAQADGGHFVVRLFEDFTQIATLGEVTTMGGSKPVAITQNYAYDAEAEAFKLTEDTNGVTVIEEGEAFADIRRLLVDPRYGLMVTWFVDGQQEDKIVHTSGGTAKLTTEYREEPWGAAVLYLNGVEISRDTKPIGSTFFSGTVNFPYQAKPTQTFVNNSHFDRDEFAFPYEANTIDHVVVAFDPDGNWAVTDWGFRYVGNGRDLYLVSYRWEDYQGSGSQLDPMGRAFFWRNPLMPLFRAKNMDPETQAQEPYASREDPRDVMGVYTYDENDVDYDQPLILNMYLFL